MNKIFLKTPTPLPLLSSPQHVHVWQIDLTDCPKEEHTYLFNCLSADEQSRALRFHFAKDRNRFIVARAALKKILAHYLTTDPQQIDFQYNAHGKPFLLNHDLQFNVSHSNEIALCAVTQKYLIGIDIEYILSEHDIDAIAQRFFSKQENQIIKNLVAPEKNVAFFNGWTRKEAFLKALGQGLAYPLKKVEVSLTEETPPIFTALHDADLAITDWNLYSLPAIPGYASALAIKGKIQEIKTWLWKNVT